MPESTNNTKAKAKGKSLVQFPDDYVVLDIETTGLNPRFNEIIELSALKVRKNEISEEFNMLVKPSGKINSFITNLTGITDAMVADAPHISEAVAEFNSFCFGETILGHNISFDISFIDAKLQKYHSASFQNDYIDTLRLARLLLPSLPNKKLGTIASHFNFDTEGMHRGLKDCKVTNLCFHKMKEIAVEKYGSVDDILKR